MATFLGRHYDGGVLIFNEKLLKMLGFGIENNKKQVTTGEEKLELSGDTETLNKGTPV